MSNPGSLLIPATFTFLQGGFIPLVKKHRVNVFISCLFKVFIFSSFNLHEIDV